MLIRIMTLKFNPLLEQFDDAALQDYLKDKEVLSVKDHFFIKNDSPYVTFIIQCHETPDDASAQSKPGKSDESWKEIINPHELPLFNTLRSWRAERAKRDGIPPYIVCTNRQLAEMVSRRPQSLSGLGDIKGFGKAKIEAYGKAILSLLRSGTADGPEKSAPSGADAPPAETQKEPESTGKLAGKEPLNVAER
jgi:superfamily II DNA helicase RecQ